MELFFIDIGCHEIYTDWVDRYVKDVDALIVVIDVTQKQSYAQAHAFLKRLRVTVPHAYVIGNKIDQGQRRIITTEMIEEIKDLYGLEAFFECSAAMKINVDTAFYQIANRLVS